MLVCCFLSFIIFSDFLIIKMPLFCRPFQGTQLGPESNRKAGRSRSGWRNERPINSACGSGHGSGCRSGMTTTTTTPAARARDGRDVRRRAIAAPAAVAAHERTDCCGERATSRENMYTMPLDPSASLLWASVFTLTNSPFSSYIICISRCFIPFSVFCLNMFWMRLCARAMYLSLSLSHISFSLFLVSLSLSLCPCSELWTP